MTTMNLVCIVGYLTNDADIKTSKAGKKYASMKVRTEKYVKINGARKRQDAVHSVLCFNEFSVDALERYGKAEARIRVTGELQYDNAGTAQIMVPMYGGEVGIMDAAPSNTNSENSSSPSQATGGVGKVAQEKQPSRRTHEELRQQHVDLDDEIPF